MKLKTLRIAQRNVFILKTPLIKMEIGITLIIISALIIAIWILIEFKRLKHKLFAIFLIGLILFLYISLTFTLKGQNLDLKTIPGITQAGKIYFSWLASATGNFKSITSNAINMNWGVNETAHK